MSTLFATFELVTATARISQGKQKPSSLRETVFIALAAPFLLDRLVQSVSNERLANMSSGEAKTCYEALLPLYEPVREFLDTAERTPRAPRFLLGFFFEPMTRNCERLLDVIESLAWAVDPELSDRITALLAPT
ncbi:MAG: hypothetical protein NTV52_01365 [Acidobacteria bacterium]|nr:hypothetical protein [Acidobacteriota bacterium]